VQRGNKWFTIEAGLPVRASSRVDGDFIAHLREDVEWLCAQLEISRILTLDRAKRRLRTGMSRNFVCGGQDLLETPPHPARIGNVRNEQRLAVKGRAVFLLLHADHSVAWEPT
jgi:hypothetical protein